MEFAKNLPDWLAACFRTALLGEIYPNIKAIAVGYNESGSVLIRYYLDREPTEFDLESIEVVATNFDSMGGKQHPIYRIDTQCVHSDATKRDLEPFSGFVYSRREYS